MWKKGAIVKECLQEYCYIVCVRKPLTVTANQKLRPRTAGHTNEEVTRAATCGEKVTEEG